MSLSDAPRKAIIESERINNEQQRQRQAQQQQEEKEYNELIKQEQELQQQLAQQQQTELSNQGDQTRAAIEKKYSDQISPLLEQKSNIWNTIPTTSTNSVKKFREGIGWYRENETIQLSRRQREEIYNTKLREVNRAIDQIKFNKAKELNYYDYSVAFPGQSLQGSVARTFNNSDPEKTSLVDLQQRQNQALEAKKEYQRQRDIAKGQSYIIAERAKLKNTIAEFDQAREENSKTQTKAINAQFTTTPTKAGDLIKKATPPKRELFQPEPDPIEPNYKAIESFEKTQKAKNDLLEKTLKPKTEELILKQGVAKDSEAFLAKSPGQARDILGIDKQRSEKAVFTFEQTQQQQKELFQKVLGASSSKEAIKLIEQYQELNEYVGTPQTANTKKGKAEQGVLIEKKIESTKSELDDYFSNKPVIISGSETITKTTELKDRAYWTIPDPENPNQNLKDKKGRELQFLSEQSANLYISRLGLNKLTTQTQELAAPVSYEFVDDKGETIPPTIGLLWKKANENYDPQKPTKADIEFNQSIREWQEKNPGKDLEIYKETEGLKTPLDKLPFEKAYLQHGTELHYGIKNIFLPEDQQVKYERTFEGALYSDLDSSAGNLLFNENNKQENYLKKYYDENIKTVEGQQKLAGSIAGSLVVLGASFIVPPIAYAKYASKFITPKNLKRAEAIADKLRYQVHQKENKLPTTLDDMNAILRENKKAVGVEMINPQTALISRGTEANPDQTAYILLRFGKKKSAGIASLYQGFSTEKPGSYREIIIQGKQSGEMRYGKKLNKDTVVYPSTLSNFKKAYDPENLAGVGSKQDVLLSDLEKYPKQLIKSVESQEDIQGSVILETKRLSQNASDKGAKLSKDAGDKFTGDLGSKEMDYYLPQKQKPQPAKQTKQELSDAYKKISSEQSKSKADVESFSKELKSNQGSTMQTGKPTGEKITIPKTNKELKNFVKSDVIESKNIYGLSATGLISSTLSEMRTAADTMAAQSQRSQANTKQSLQTFQESKLNTDLKTKTEIKNEISEKIILDLERIQQRRQVLDPRFSLITSLDSSLDVEQGLTTRTKERYKLKEEFTQIFPRPTPTEEKITTKTPPNLPGFTLNLEEKKELEARQPKTKKGIMYFRWNTNTESVGQYLPIRDLTTGKTSKAIKEIDRLQKKVNKKGYSQKKQEQVDRYYSTRIKEKKGGALVRKSNIVNISTPKGKEAKKFLKKLKVNLGF